MTPETIAVALVAVVAGALLKSISGVGLPLVMIPAITLVADVETAVAVTTVPNLALNLTLAAREREARHETRDLPILATAGFIGAILGTLVLVSVPERALIAALCVVVLVYVVTFFAKPDLHPSPETARRLSPGVGLAAGAMQGAVGISGPIVAAWIHGYRLPRHAHIFSVTTLFAAAGAAQLPTLVASGRMDGLWSVSLLACVPALATVPVGRRLRDALSTDGFDRLVVMVIGASAIGLAARNLI